MPGTSVELLRSPFAYNAIVRYIVWKARVGSSGGSTGDVIRFTTLAPGGTAVYTITIPPGTVSKVVDFTLPIGGSAYTARPIFTGPGSTPTPAPDLIVDVQSSDVATAALEAQLQVWYEPVPRLYPTITPTRTVSATSTATATATATQTASATSSATATPTP